MNDRVPCANTLTCQQSEHRWHLLQQQFAQLVLSSNAQVFSGTRQLLWCGLQHHQPQLSQNRRLDQLAWWHRWSIEQVFPCCVIIGVQWDLLWEASGETISCAEFSIITFPHNLPLLWGTDRINPSVLLQSRWQDNKNKFLFWENYKRNLPGGC